MRSLAMGAFFALFSGGFSWAADLPTTLKRITPPYPAVCITSDSEEGSVERVTVAFEIDARGRTQNLRISESTNPCFNDVAVNAVRGWLYEEPRRENGRVPIEVETTFAFKLEAPTRAEDLDARPLRRYPPQYPQHCMAAAETNETVFLEFEIDEEGRTRNIEIIDTTEKCLNSAAVKAVEKWLYRPKLVDGVPIVRKGVRTRITFQLADTRLSDFTMRPRIANRIKKARRLLEQQKIAEAIEVLDELDKRYGDDFRDLELKNFLRIRAQARILNGDYAAAIDDLRLLKNQGLATEEVASFDDLISKLEAAIAAEEQSNESRDTVDAPPENTGE